MYHNPIDFPSHFHISKGGVHTKNSQINVHEKLISQFRRAHPHEVNLHRSGIIIRRFDSALKGSISVPVTTLGRT